MLTRIEGGGEILISVLLGPEGITSGVAQESLITSLSSPTVLRSRKKGGVDGRVLRSYRLAGSGVRGTVQFECAVTEK